MTRLRPALRRIVVASDAATPIAACLDYLVQMASRFDLELVGLFVEDDDLLRMAALPGARRISFLTGAQESFDVASTESELRSLAGVFQRQLAAAAERSQVKWSFRVVRGRAATAVARATDADDLLAIPRSARPLLTEARLEIAVHSAAEEARASVLVLPADARIGGAALVPYDGSRAADQALLVAARLASEGPGALEVILFANNADELRILARRARECVGDHPIVLRCSAAADNLEAIRELLQRHGGGLLVLGEGCLPHISNAIRSMADRLDMPILTVRSSL